MRKYDSLTRRRCLYGLAKFQKSLDFLPSSTPVFSAFTNGAILHSVNMSKADRQKFSLWQLVHKDCLQRLLKNTDSIECCVLRKTGAKSKSFIVIYNRNNNCFNGVICSCEEKGCIDLKQYYTRLVSYKDYLESFTNLSFRFVSRKSVVNCFSMRIMGAGYLMKISSENDGNRSLVCNSDILLEKLCLFVEKSAYDKNTVHSCLTPPCRVKISSALFKILICCANLCQRKSIDLSYEINCSIDSEMFCICFSCHSSQNSEHDIYEDSIIYALDESLANYELSKTGGVYKIVVRLKIDSAPVSEFVSDIKLQNDFLNRITSSPGVKELMLMMLD